MVLCVAKRKNSYGAHDWKPREDAVVLSWWGIVGKGIEDWVVLYPVGRW